METKISNAPYIDPVPGSFPLVCEGPIPKVTTDLPYSEFIKHLEIMKSCGFNSFTKYIDVADSRPVVEKFLNAAKEVVVKYFVRQWSIADPDLNYCKDFVNRYKDHEALGGWNIGDEPNSDAVARWIASSKIILENDSSHINFFGLSTNPASPVGVSLDQYYHPSGNSVLDDPINKDLVTYLNYIQAEMGPSLWLFDYYPLMEKVNNGTATGEYYVKSEQFFRYLEVFRAKSLETKRPFWSYVLLRTIYFYDYAGYMDNKYSFWLRNIMPDPTVDGLRYASFTALAYGAQGLIFWGYCRGLAKLDCLYNTE